MKIKKWLPLLLAGIMTFSVFGVVGCDNVSDGGDTTGGTQQGSNNEGGGNGGNEGGGSGGNEDSGGSSSGGNEDSGGGNEDSGPTWSNADIWLAQTPILPTSAPTRLPDQSDSDLRTTTVSVHDPSIFRDPNAKGNKYYAFGTHFAVASSTDLRTWTQEARDNDWTKLYGDVGSYTHMGKEWPNTLQETVELVKPTYATDEKGENATISTTWAPDVEYYNGKYYMYYSLTKAFGSDESAIGRVESDNVLGPYTNNVVLFDSVGKTGNHPNCIDPELFYDKEGKLWMVYGSAFAGVYIKELYNEGTNWGLPKEDGWGKLLWKGGSDVVEGPFVFYNATNDYYYLMTSYGALMRTYNMRIARSKNPDGPYVDAEDTDVSTSNNNGSIHGNVVAGNYKFSWANGYAAMGHNSVIKDKQGRYLVVYHTRYQEGTAGVTANHNLYVNQLYFNEDGWPVMSPTAYVGESPCTVTETQVTGDYEIVLHSTATTQTFVASQDYTLSADGKVTRGGTAVGTWTLKQNFYIDVTINDVTYKGVVALGWNNYSTGAVFSITAISDKGYSLWGVAKTAATKA